MTQTTETATDTTATEEHRARQALGLGDAPSVELLARQPRAGDQKRFRSLQRSHPVTLQALTLGDFAEKRFDVLLATTVKAFMAGHPLLIKRLGNDVLRLTTEEELRASPSTCLLRVLDSAPARELAVQLLKALRWHGAAPGEQTPDSLRHQLLCRAITVYSARPPHDQQTLAGFRWQDPDHWGKNYPTLRSDFEQHLLRTGQAQYTHEAILLAHVLQSRLSRDFAVRDIPSDLRYKSSAVWVNFMHGVLLAEALGLDDAQPLPFQQLVNLPLERSAEASPETLETIARLRLAPALEWAICNGVVRPRPAADYDESDFRTALSALETHNEQVAQAVLALDLPPPRRMEMAKRIKDELVGNEMYETDGRRLDYKYTFVDVYAAGGFDNGEKWLSSAPDGKTRGDHWLRLDDKRILRRESMDHRTGRIGNVLFLGMPYISRRALPDVQALFESEFKHYLSTIKAAYQTLILNLLTSLPLADRRALETGDVRVLCLRGYAGLLDEETVQARRGFILQVQADEQFLYYEVVPSAGIIRRRTHLRYAYIKGDYTELPLHASIPDNPFDPDLEQLLLLDWRAHLEGTEPKRQTRTQKYIDQVAHRPAALTGSESGFGEGIATRASPGLNALAQCVASNFPFVDEQRLYTQARGLTAFDKERIETEHRREALLALVKGLVPFWGSIEDLQSDSDTQKAMGGIGLFLDLASFLFPIGKFISGSVRLIRLAANTSRMAIKTSLPPFSALTRKLLTGSLVQLNPLDGIPKLLKATASGVRQGLSLTTRASHLVLKRLTAHPHPYRQVQGYFQATDPAHWKPLANGDRLATVNGIDDVPVRNTSTTDPSRLHLVEPLTLLPYGRRLSLHPGNFAQGRSTYPMLPPTQTHALALLPDKAHVRELLEVNGRTTLLIDDVPYRLDSGQLRRADLIDDQAVYKSLPCRAKRSPGDEVCQTVYVTREPAPTPPIGSQDESKGWAPWFGDTLYTPAVAGQPTALKALKALETFKATAHFQKGIYARIKARVAYGRRNLFDEFKAGAILVPSKDESKRYLFTRLNAGDFYVAELSPGQSIFPSLTLHKAQTLPADLAEELKTVYTGSLNANNMVRIHGQALVERALKTMEEIAIPIGGHANPPETLKWLKVDTSPGEALLFDHCTRMMVSKLADGAQSWSRSRAAPDAFRQRTADIFDTLFAEKTVTVVRNSDLRINQTMDRFQRLLPNGLKTGNARNIAFADVVTSSGTREVYVSVSGAQGLTGELPLFKNAASRNTVVVDGTTYINADHGQAFARTSLNLTGEGKVLAIPHTIKNIDTYTPAMTSRPTSLDSEAKLIALLREKYPDKSMLKSVDVATTMPPCNSCSVVIKEFGHDGSAGALNILWG